MRTMTQMWLALFLTLSAQAEPMTQTLGLYASVERIVLTGVQGPVTLENETLYGRIRLSVADGQAGKVLAAFKKVRPGQCESARAVDSNHVELRCSEARVEGKVATPVGPGRTDPVLELKELRGLPFAVTEVIPFFAYPPQNVGLRVPCPGASPAASGECAIGREAWAEAEHAFQEAVTTRDGLFASLRLGDLQLRRGDALGAAESYTKAGLSGYVGRMAASKLCDLTGACEGDRRARVLRTEHMPEPMRTELELREIRRAAYLGQAGEVASRMLKRLEDPNRMSACDGSVFRFCREMTLFALRQPEADMGVALDVFMRLPGTAWRREDLVLVREAARAAEEIELPQYAAKLLAATTDHVPPGELDAHLRHIAGLYLSTGDRGRVRATLDYAKSRLSTQVLKSRAWLEIGKKVRMAAPVAVRSTSDEKRWQSLTDGTDDDLKRAYGAVTQSQAENETKPTEQPQTSSSP